MNERSAPHIPPVPGDEFAEATLEKVKVLLGQLGRKHHAHLFDLIHKGNLGRSSKAERIADLLLDLLRGKRTAHARRLWTAWLDPVLLRGEGTLDCVERLPGAIHLIDAGAWWLALSRRMPDLVGRVQATVERECLRHPLDAVLESGIGRDAAEALRHRSLEEIARIGRNPVERAKLLADANEERNRLLKARGRGVGARMTPADLATLVLMLETAPAWRRVAPTGLQAPPQKALSDVGVLGREGVRLDGAALLALAHLHSDCNPHWLMELEQALPELQFEEQAIAHFRFSGQRLRDTLTAELEGLGRPRPRLGLAATMGAAVDDLFAWYDAVLALGIRRQPRGAAAVQEIMGAVLTLFDTAVVPTLNQRIQQLSLAPPPSGVMEFVRLVDRMADRLARRGLVGARKPWSRKSGEHVLGLFRDVASEGSGSRLALLAQLAELAEMMGFSIEMSALNHGLLQTVESALPESTDFTDAEMGLIERVLVTAAEERRRCKWWASAELVSLLETAAATEVGAAILERVIQRRRT